MQICAGVQNSTWGSLILAAAKWLEAAMAGRSKADPAHAMAAMPIDCCRSLRLLPAAHTATSTIAPGASLKNAAAVLDQNRLRCAAACLCRICSDLAGMQMSTCTAAASNQLCGGKIQLHDLMHHMKRNNHLG